MLKRAGIYVPLFALLMICSLFLVPSGFAQTPLPPAISQTFSSNTIPLNGTTVMTVTLSNPNPEVSLNFVSFDDRFPLGLTTPFPFTGNNACGGIVTDAGDEILLGNVVLGPSASLYVFNNVDRNYSGYQDQHLCGERH